MRYLTAEISVRGQYGHAVADIRLIGDAYIRARYSQAGISEDESYQVQEAWRRLRGVLFRLLFSRRPERRPVA